MKWIIILLAVIGFLVTTNPDSNSFVNYVHNHPEVKWYLGYESTLESDLRGLREDRTQRLEDKLTGRRSYILLSTYVLWVGPKQDKVRRKFIGVAGQFVQVDGPQTQAVPSSGP